MIDHEEKSVLSEITPAKIEEQTPQAISRTRSNPLLALVSMIGLLSLMAVSLPQPSSAAEQVLYSFCAQTSCSHGADPYNLVMDASGNLFGIAGGGAAGMIVELAKTDGGYASAPKVLYPFCAQTNCPDGAFWPYTSTVLIIDESGNLYGAMPKGGVNGSGTVFELAKTGGGYASTLTILYSFCAQGGSSCTDGAVPSALLLDASGNLYGTTWSGGTPASGQPYGVGTVFRLISSIAPGLPAPRITWTENVLYSFCSVMAGGHCTDGSFPAGSLVMDNCGNLYGTATGQGSIEAGVVFELTPIWDKTKWTETPLHTFCFPTNCTTDGEFPLTGVIADKSGNLNGTTQWGGANCEVESPSGHVGPGCGTVFKMSP
jgi:hypothetical protein